MKIWVNQELVDIIACMSLFDILKQKNIVDNKGIAVAINQKVITKKEWTYTSLSEGDKVIVIEATQGG